MKQFSLVMLNGCGLDALLVLLAATLAFLPGCAETPRPATFGPNSCVVVFESDFHHDRVVVFIDDVQVYSRRITTDEVLGLAASTRVTTRGPQFHLRVEVPARHFALQQTIDRQSWPYLLIALNPREAELTLVQQKTIPTYE